MDAAATDRPPEDVWLLQMANPNLERCYIIMLAYYTFYQLLMQTEMINSKVQMQNILWKKETSLCKATWLLGVCEWQSVPRITWNNLHMCASNSSMFNKKKLKTPRAQRCISAGCQQVQGKQKKNQSISANQDARTDTVLLTEYIKNKEERATPFTCCSISVTLCFIRWAFKCSLSTITTIIGNSNYNSSVQN